MSTNQTKISFCILFLITLIDWVGFGLVYPMFSAMVFEHGNLLFSHEPSDLEKGLWLGALLSAMPIAQFFFSPIAGALSDKKGRKHMLLITLVLTIIGYVFSFYAAKSQNIYLLILGRITIGIGAGNVAIISASVADLSGENQKVKHFGFINMAAGLGFTLGPYIGGRLSYNESLGGFSAPFIFAGLVTIISLILVHFFYKETNHNLNRSDLTPFKGAQNFIKAFTNPTLRFVFLCAFIFCFGWSFFWEFIPVYWIKEHNLNTMQIGTFYAYAACFYAASCGLIVRKISSILRPQGIYFLGLIGLSITIGLILFDSNLKSLWYYIPLQQSMLSFIFPTASAMVSMSVQNNTQGESLGILASINSSAFSFSPLVSGVIVGTSHLSPIWAGSLSMLIAAVIFYFGCIKNKFTLRSLLRNNS
ncbi:MAG: MFS transporter [Chlamydiae bacterium]|nr:MFS transporter [Chlamydiota bacterium]